MANEEVKAAPETKNGPFYRLAYRLEKRVTEVLSKEPVLPEPGPEDNFFSRLAYRVVNRAKELLDKEPALEPGPESNFFYRVAYRVVKRAKELRGEEPEPALEPKRKAKDNPWYTLAMLHGVPSSGQDEIATKNRVTWNRCMAPMLSDELKNALVERGWTREELLPFSDKEVQCLETRIGSSISGSLVDLSNTRFGHLLTRGFVFPDTNFSGVEFSNRVVFYGAAFTGDVDFQGATLDENVHFILCTFSGTAQFNNVAVGGLTDFTRTTFKEDADFSGSTFGGDARFASVTFDGRADFAGATFKADVDFCRDDLVGPPSVFNVSANFRGATFCKSVHFSDARILGISRFDYAKFSDYARFTNTEFTHPTSFGFARFATHPPEFSGAKLHEGTIWRLVRWPPPPKDQGVAGDHVEAYERLKQEMDKLKKHNDELDFFVRELRCRRVYDGFWRGLPIAFYGILCKYGLSYVRPLGILVIIVILGAIPIRSHFGVGWTLTVFAPPISGEALGMSFANTFGVLGIRKELINPEVLQQFPGWLKVMATIQNILGIILLFLFGVGIRNRFRMK